jgi:hypothetical protein
MKIVTLPFLILIISCSDNSTTVEKNILMKPDETVLNPLRGKIISDSTNILERKVQRLELEYIVWGCACANWITPADRIKYDTNGLADHCIFIEPADSSLELPDGTFQFDKENIRVTGQFYVRKDYPKGTIEMEEHLDKAKVFRFTKIEVIKKNK